MKLPRTLFLIALSATAMDASAVDAYSPVVGFLRFDCPANSDTRVSVPFHVSPRWAGQLSAAPANQGNGIARLTLGGTPAFAAGELTNSPHLLLCRDAAGPEGRYFTINSHTAGTVDIKAIPDELTGLTQNGLVSVIPAWTIQTLFPAGTQNTFHPSSGKLASGRGSELLLFNETTTGDTVAPSRRFFVTTTGWFEVGNGYPAAGAVMIAPGQSFIVRHPAGVPPTTFVAMNQVYGGVVKLPVRVTQGKKQDTVIAPPRPVIQKLSELDLGGAFEDSTDLTPGGRKDELHIYSNAAPLQGTSGQNKGPAAIYFRHAGAWVEDLGSSFPGSNLVEIDPAAGLVIRKAIGSNNDPLLWSNAPLYDVTAP